MQVLTAYLTDPGLRPAPFEQIKALYPQIIAQNMATPAGAFGIQSSSLLAPGDARQTLPTAEEINGWTIEELKSGLTADLGEGPVNVVMVGDVTVDDAIAAVGSTLAALPARPALPTPAAGADVRRFPEGTSTPIVMRHTGPAEQALGYVAWPTADSIGDRTESRLASMLAAVMELRVTEEIRENQALAYSPNVGASSSDVFADYGSIAVTAQTTPETQAALFTAIDAIAASRRDTPITEDELTRARAPRIETIRRSQAGNEYWLGQLSDVASDPEAVAQVTSQLSDIEGFTVADIQAAAQRWLVPSKAWRASVLAAPAQ